MAKSNSTKSTDCYTPTHCPKTGRKFTKEERRAANKLKFKKEQEARRAALAKQKKAEKAAKSKKTKAPATPAPSKTAQTVHRDNIEKWLADNPKRKTMKLGEFEQLTGRTKMAKRLDRKGRTDSGLSKRNNKLEVQAQYKGGTLA